MDSLHKSGKIQKGFDCIGVSVVYFCHDGEGKFVMAKRNRNARDEHGRWDIGGGALELNDDVIKTVHKEIKEEYDTNVFALEFLGYRDVHRVHEGAPTHWIALDFKAQVDPGKVRNAEPHKFDEVRWFTLDSLPENLHSQLSDFLDRYRLQLGS